MKTVLLMMGLVLAMTACKAKSDAEAIAEALKPGAEKPPETPVTVKPTLDCSLASPLNGKFKGELFQFMNGMAHQSGFADSWDVTLYRQYVSNPCHNFGPGDGITFRLVKTMGGFTLQDSKAVMFYDLNVTPNFHKETSNGRGQVTSITDKEVFGELEAYVDENTGVCGQFQIVRCD